MKCKPFQQSTEITFQIGNNFMLLPSHAVKDNYMSKAMHTMIVRFTTWRHRTAVYRARKNCSSNKIRLDLTNKRLDAVTRLYQLLQSRKLGFVFADVNCRLCARINEKFHYFENEDGLIIQEETASNDEDTTEDDASTVVEDNSCDDE